MAKCPKLTDLTPAICGVHTKYNQPFKTLHFFPDNIEDLEKKSGIIKGIAKTPEGVTIGPAVYDTEARSMQVTPNIKQIKHE